MGVTSKTVIKIECDNPNCPGNSLDPKSYDGWIRVSASTQFAPPEGTPRTGPGAHYALPVQMAEKIFCSADCAGSINEAIAAVEEARKLEIDASLPEPV
jgi:hypothetical protein